MVLRFLPACQARIVRGHCPPNCNLNRSNESGRPKGVTIISGLPGPNCQRRLAAKLKFDNKEENGYNIIDILWITIDIW